MNSNNELMVVNSAELVRQSTDVAGLCKEIVTKTALTIQGKKYVRVEGWQSIATAHGCAAGARDVERVDGGFRAIGELRRIQDGTLVATAEGFVGEDEPIWFGGSKGDKKYDKRPDYAIRAMAQTRAISRVCRSAFAHCVVLMDSGLSTTPAEEVPFGGFQDAGNGQSVEDVNREAGARQEQREKDAATKGHQEPIHINGDWRDYYCTFGKKDGPLRGKQLGELTDSNLRYLYERLIEGDQKVDPKDAQMVRGLRMWKEHIDIQHSVPADEPPF